MSTASLSPARPIGLVSAMQSELSAVLAHMPEECAETHGRRTFWRGRWQGHDVIAVLSGIGKVAAATTATALIERFDVAAIVLTGVAGGLAAQARVGDIVVARSLLQHDMNATPLVPCYEVPFYDRAHFDTDPALSEALARAARSVLAQPQRLFDPAILAEFALHAPRVHEGLILSGDHFISSNEESADLCRRLPDALAVEMEGAAIAQVCHDYQVPCAALRTISDRADDTAHIDFTRFTDHVARYYSIAILESWLRDWQA